MRTRRKKEDSRTMIIEYIANPENPLPPSHDFIAKEILGYKCASTFNQVFTPQEIFDAKIEGNKIRRSRMEWEVAQLDDATLNRGKQVDSSAADKVLAYQRAIGWNPKQEHEVKGGLVIELVQFGETKEDDEGKDSE